MAFVSLHRIEIFRSNFLPLSLLLLSRGSTALVGLNLFYEIPRSHNDAPHSIGHLWTSDQPVAVDLYLTTLITHNRQTSMTPAGFEPTMPASERPQSYALECAVIGTGLSGTDVL